MSFSVVSQILHEGPVLLECFHPFVIEADDLERAPDVYAAQLHFLGRWYHTARIAVESAGGFGEPVTIFLRDGKDGRPAYRGSFAMRLHCELGRGRAPHPSHNTPGAGPG
jgi:hypothetical protein